MSGLTRGYLDELKAAGSFSLLEVATDDKLDSIITKVKSELGAPYRMSATWPTRDAILHFAAPRAIAADGGAKIPPIQDDLTQMGAAEITLNLQTGAITGGTILRNGAAFTLPTANQNQYVRVAFVQKSDGSIDSNWSSAQATYGALPDPGTLFSTLDGNPLGVLDLQQTTAGSGATYKTADSTTDIVEPAVGGVPRIWRFGSGSGVGGGGDSSFKLQSLTSSTALIKKGRWDLGQYKLISGNVSVDVPVDVSIDMATLVPSPAAATAYYLFIDLNALAAESAMSDTGMVYKKVYQASHFATSLSMDVDRRRYSHVGTLKTSGATWTGAKVISSPSRDVAPEIVANTTRVRTTIEGMSRDMPYELLTLCDIGEDTSLVDGTSDGSASYRDRTWNLPAIGNALISANLLDQALFIDEGLTVEKIDVVVIWKVGKVDTAATYYVSRNGGTNYETVTMERVEGTDTFVGQYIFGTYADTSDLRLKIVSGTGSVAVDGFGVFYRNIDAGMMITGRNNLEVQTFNSKTEKLSPCTFTLTRFIPDPDFLVVICDGAVYQYGDFAIDGYKITFADNFFQTPDSRTMLVKFMHVGAGTFDASDRNANLMATNHLGSTDTNMDRSLAGRGIMLRRPDGTLRELTINDSDLIAIKDV